MKQQILHTPEGVRDIYSLEYGKKHIVEEKLQNLLLRLLDTVVLK